MRKIKNLEVGVKYDVVRAGGIVIWPVLGRSATGSLGGLLHAALLLFYLLFGNDSILDCLVLLDFFKGPSVKALLSAHRQRLKLLEDQRHTKGGGAGRTAVGLRCGSSLRCCGGLGCCGIACFLATWLLWSGAVNAALGISALLGLPTSSFGLQVLVVVLELLWVQLPFNCCHTL